MFLCSVAVVLLLLLSLLRMVSPAYISKSQKSAACAEPVCPFCQMAAAVDTTDAAVPQFLDGPSAASAPAAAAAAAARCCCCSAALTLSCTYTHVLRLLLCSAMPYYRIPFFTLYGSLFKSDGRILPYLFFDRKHSRVRANAFQLF